MALGERELIVFVLYKLGEGDCLGLGKVAAVFVSSLSLLLVLAIAATVFLRAIGLVFLAVLDTEDGIRLGLGGVFTGLVFLKELAIGLVFLAVLVTEGGVLIGLDFLGGVFTGLFLVELASSHFLWLYMDGL